MQDKIFSALRDEWRTWLIIVSLVSSAAFLTGAMNSRLDSIEARLDRIENNHLAHLYAAVQQLQIDVAKHVK